MLTKLISKTFLTCYKLTTEIRGKLFSLLIGPSFLLFGKKSLIMCPLRSYGENRIKIGDRVFIGSNSWLQTIPDGANRSIAISIGNGTSIAGACHISAALSIIIENDVLMGRNVQISDHKHAYENICVPILVQGIDKRMPVLIRSGAWIGENVVVCPGVTIGRGSVVGANSVVNRDIPDFHVAAGSPVQIIKRIGPADGK